MDPQAAHWGSAAEMSEFVPKANRNLVGEKGPRRAGLGMRLCQMTVGQLWVPEPQLKAYLSPQTGALPPPSISSALKMGMLSPGSI